MNISHNSTSVESLTFGVKNEDLQCLPAQGLNCVCRPLKTSRLYYIIFIWIKIIRKPYDIQIVSPAEG